MASSSELLAHSLPQRMKELAILDNANRERRTLTTIDPAVISGSICTAAN